MGRHVYPVEPELRSHQASAEMDPFATGRVRRKALLKWQDFSLSTGHLCAPRPQAVKGRESRAGPSLFSSTTIPCLWFLALAPVGLQCVFK